MERWVGKVALVTGASAGIGASIATELVKRGVIVYAGARRLDRLEALAAELTKESGKLFPVKMDLTKEEDIVKAFEVIKNNSGGIDILVNNAGIVIPSSLTDGNADDWRRLFDTNVMGLCIATREAARSMLDRDVAGHIIHINSVVGHVVPSFVGSKLNIYPASKYAVTALSEVLRQEFLEKKANIKITSLSPGIVRTEIDEANNLQLLGPFYEKLRVLDPVDVANALVYVLGTPPHVQVSELTIRPLQEP